MGHQKILKRQAEAIVMVLEKSQCMAVEVTEHKDVLRAFFALASYYFMQGLKRYSKGFKLPRAYWKYKECEALSNGFNMQDIDDPFNEWSKAQKDLWLEVRRAVIKAGHNND